MLDIAKKRAELTPNRSAVYIEGRGYSYAELNKRAGKLAQRLAEAGVQKGDRVGILAHNALAHLDLILATPKLGFIYTPFNYRLSAREQRDIAAYVRPKLLFFDAENAAKAEAIAQQDKHIQLISLDTDSDWLQEAHTSSAKRRGKAVRLTPPSLQPEDIQMILFTGGTTGMPKGAMQPYRQGFYNAVGTALSWGLREDDCVIQATPCFHAAVNAFTVPLLYMGASVVLQRAFDPGDYLRLVERHRATILFMVPNMFQMLVDHLDFAETDLSSVRWAISGGAACPEPVREAFVGRGVRFKQGYGLSEAGVNCFAIELADAAARPASVGKPLLHAEAVIRDEAGKPVKPGEVGELTLKGPHVFSGYFERPEATAEVLRDGWLWTGDLAKTDEDGFFYMVGRRKEMFISGGENIFPAEIENALYEHPAVAECTVLGVADERWGEVGLAVIVPRQGKQDTKVTEEELSGYLKTRLASYKVPKHIRFTDALPKSGAGKILKLELAKHFGMEPA